MGLAFAAIKMYNKDPPRDMTEPVHNSVTAMAIGQPLLAHGDLQETRPSMHKFSTFFKESKLVKLNHDDCHRDDCQTV